MADNTPSAGSEFSIVQDLGKVDFEQFLSELISIHENEITIKDAG